jgi:hypothetical protein
MTGGREELPLTAARLRTVITSLRLEVEEGRRDDLRNAVQIILIQ